MCLVRHRISFPKRQMYILYSQVNIIVKSVYLSKPTSKFCCKNAFYVKFFLVKSLKNRCTQGTADCHQPVIFHLHNFPGSTAAATVVRSNCFLDGCEAINHLIRTSSKKKTFRLPLNNC